MNRPLLHIASDIFFADWASTVSGGLWLSFRPHVIVRDENDPEAFETQFKDWIVAGHNGQDVDYKMVAQGDMPSDPDSLARFQPVTFPSDVDITVAVQYSNGGWTNIGIVERSKRLVVRDPDALATVNKPRVAGEGKNDIGGEPSRPPKQGKPFVYAYIENIRDAMSENASLAVIADEMMRAQLLGRTFHANDDMVAGISTDTAIIPVPSTGGGMTVASLHSLLGHTLCLGNRADLAKLKTITDVKITLKSGSVTLKEFQFATLIGQGQSSIASFFSALEGQFPGKVELTWVEDLAKRIYVNDALTAFPYRAAGDWFVRRHEGALGLPEKDLSLADVRRLRVDIRLPDKLDANTLTTTLSVTLPELEFQPFAVLQCRLRLYRGFPKKGGPDGAELMRLVPYAEDRADFLAELNRLTQGLDWATQQAKLQQFFTSALWEDESEQALNPKPEFVFWGMLPWDQEDGDALPTLLFFGSSNTGTDTNGNTVNLLIKRSTLLIAQLRSSDSPYWETRYPSPPGGPNNKEEFHRLRLVTDLPAEELKLLVPSMGLAGDVTFHTAQSSSRVEAVAKVHYPLVHDYRDAVIDVTPSEEFQDDLVSFVNLRLAGCVLGSSSEDLTGRGNLYPVYQENYADSGRRLHTYHFSTAGTVMATDENNDLDLAAVPRHFKALYDRASSLPTAYTISPRLAHVLGPELVGKGDVSGAAEVILPDLNVARPLDVPVSMASTVRTNVPEGTGQKALKFLTLKFSSPDASPYVQDEVATLIFRRNFLKASSVGTNTDRQALYVEAWNAVAELCAAEKIVLEPYLVRFDFRAGYGSDKKFRIGDALQRMESKEFVKNITKDVQNALADLFATQNEDIPQDDLEINVVLSRSSDKNRIFRLSNAVEFRLNIERLPSKVFAGDSSTWTLARLVTTTDDGMPLPVDEYYDENGLKVKEVNSNDPDEQRIKLGFDRWLESLSMRSDGIDADDSEAQETQVFRSLVGGGAASRVATETPSTVDLDDWIVPEGPIDPAPGSANITLLPIGFRPIKFHPLFGAKTDTLYRRYLQWIQSLINCSNSHLVDTNSTKEWSQYFKVLYDYGQDASGYSALMNNLAELAWPMHDPETKYKDKLIFPELIRDLAAATSTGGSIRDEMVARIAADIKRDPSAFFDTKAYLYSRLTGDSITNSVLPSSFFRMSSFRKISESVDDLVTLSVEESFSPNEGHFGFLEPLSDRRYDDEFKVMVPELQTFEAIIDRSINKPDSRYSQGTTTLAIPVAQCAIPNGVMGNDTEPSVFLASRKRVGMPQLLAAVPIKNENVSAWTDIDRAKSFDLTALKRGQLEEVNSNENNAYRWVGSSEPMVMSERLDDPMVVFIMSIEGDEEMPIESLNQDSVRVNVARLAAIAQSMESSYLVKETERDFAKQLSETVDFNSVVENFDLAIAPAIFKQITEGVQPAKIMLPEGSNEWLPISFKKNQGKDEIGIEINRNEPNNWPHRNGGIGAHLLRNTNDTDSRIFILIVLAELPVWDSYRIEALQARNLMTAGGTIVAGRIFDRKFGMVSERVSNNDPLSFEAVVNVYQNEPIKLGTAPLTIEDLVSKLLLTEHDFTNDIDLYGSRAILSNDSPWRSHDLSVTISHEQCVAMPQAYFNDDGSEALSVNVAKPYNRPLFPLANIQVNKDGAVDKPFDWYAEGVVDYQVDFHWSSATNLRFFSVKGVRCRLES